MKPHRLTSMMALGGKSATAAETEIREALVAAGGRVPEAALALGVHPKSLHRWLTKWKLRNAAKS